MYVSLLNTVTVRSKILISILAKLNKFELGTKTNENIKSNKKEVVKEKL